MNPKLTPGSRVLIFFLYPGVVQDSELQIALIKQLIRSGLEVDIVRCRGSITSPCATKESIHGPGRALSHRRDLITCKFCVRKGDQIPESESIRHLFIEDLLNEEDLVSSRKLANEVRPSDWTQFVYAKLPLGRFASYVPLIRAKAVSESDVQSVWRRYVSELETCILVARSIEKLVDKREYDLALVFGGLYGPERTFHRMMTDAGVPTVILDGSTLSQQLHTVIHGYSTDKKWIDAVSSMEWECEKSRPMSSQAAKVAFRHHKSLVDNSSPFVFSSPRNTSLRTTDIYNALRIPINAQVIVFLVSSPDEEVGREQSSAEPPQKDQDFVSLQKKAVERMKRYAELNPHVHLVIRLHPRLFQAKRSRVQSPALEYFEGLGGQAATNIRIDSPANCLSLYDLAQITSVAVTHLSTSALEFLALGLPVVVTNQNFNTCPQDIVEVPRDDRDCSLFEALDRALSKDADIERSRGVFRWWTFVSRYNQVLRSSSGGSEAESITTLRTTARLKKFFVQNFDRRYGISNFLKDKILRGIVGEIWMLQNLGTRSGGTSVVPEGLWETLGRIASGQNQVSSGTPMRLEAETAALHEHLSEVFRGLAVDPTTESKLGRLYLSLLEKQSTVR